MAGSNGTVLKVPGAAPADRPPLPKGTKIDRGNASEGTVDKPYGPKWNPTGKA